jgi:hypothetical protein
MPISKVFVPLPSMQEKVIAELHKEMEELQEEITLLEANQKTVGKKLLLISSQIDMVAKGEMGIKLPREEVQPKAKAKAKAKPKVKTQIKNKIRHALRQGLALTKVATMKATKTEGQERSFNRAIKELKDSGEIKTFRKGAKGMVFYQKIK